MSVYFNAEEILDMAEQIERNGQRFYRRAAEIVKDIPAQKLMLQLADMEVEHEKTFSKMKTELSEQESSPTIYDPYIESLLYLKAMADDQVFDMKSDMSAKLTGKETVEELLRTAIQKEKDSVVFYIGMKELVPANLGQSKIDEIIKEELSHVSLLSNTLKLLLTGKGIE